MADEVTDVGDENLKSISTSKGRTGAADACPLSFSVCESEDDDDYVELEKDVYGILFVTGIHFSQGFFYAIVVSGIQFAIISLILIDLLDNEDDRPGLKSLNPFKIPSSADPGNGPFEALNNSARTNVFSCVAQCCLTKFSVVCYLTQRLQLRNF